MCIAILMTAVLVWLGALLRCEILTSHYDDMIEEAYFSDPALLSLLGIYDSFEVISSDGGRITVCFMNEKSGHAYVIPFDCHDGKLQSKFSVQDVRQSLVWNRNQTSFKIIWPYILH